ncbi:putative F-box plant protein [Trifolium pratense]|uniref:Putative F-box plant protein n=1 Tax=Trifolium pratense TaxID=57577 RepID=A0A2K3PJN1_TRIPR|nr:putative F-box plant protein [Trifolium pratense]
MLWTSFHKSHLRKLRVAPSESAMTDVLRECEYTESGQQVAHHLVATASFSCLYILRETERLNFPEELKKEEILKKMLQSHGCCFLDNIKPGIWRADLQLVRCLVYDLNTCDGTMQTLDARHIELFLCEGYQNGSWEYEVVGSHDVKKRADGATGSIFRYESLKLKYNNDQFVPATLDGYRILVPF